MALHERSSGERSHVPYRTAHEQKPFPYMQGRRGNNNLGSCMRALVPPSQIKVQRPTPPPAPSFPSSSWYAQVCKIQMQEFHDDLGSAGLVGSKPWSGCGGEGGGGVLCCFFVCLFCLCVCVYIYIYICECVCVCVSVCACEFEFECERVRCFSEVGRAGIAPWPLLTPCSRNQGLAKTARFTS